MTTLREKGASATADAWNAFAPAKYRIDAALAEQNLLAHPLFHEKASLWHEGAFVAIKKSAASLYLGPNAKVAHLSLFRFSREEDSSDNLCPPLAAAIEILRDEGYEAVVVGSDGGHFLPGLPTDFPGLSRTLKRMGFVRGGLAFDLERDLRDLQPGVFAMGSGHYRSLKEEDVGELDRFLQREFPGRWRYDVSRKVEAEGPQTVFGLFIDGLVEGFALIQQDGCRRPIGGAVWKSDLGPSWGSLGPIGVSRELRGQRHGAELLNASLVELRNRGVGRTIIDWTELLDFYGEEGFSVNRTYRSYRLNL